MCSFRHGADTFSCPQINEKENISERGLIVIVRWWGPLSFMKTLWVTVVWSGKHISGLRCHNSCYATVLHCLRDQQQQLTYQEQYSSFFPHFSCFLSLPSPINLLTPFSAYSHACSITDLVWGFCYKWRVKKIKWHIAIKGSGCLQNYWRTFLEKSNIFSYWFFLATVALIKWFTAVMEKSTKGRTKHRKIIWITLIEISENE